jgi:hypothetical protein
MTAAGPALSIEPGRDYGGHPAHHVANGQLWIDVLSSAGPRIVGLGLAGSAENLLAETPDIGWDTANGRYELLGGHRLWFAPEDPDRVAIPDLDGLVIEPLSDGVRLMGRLEPTTGLIRVIEIRLDPTTPSLTMRHELRNNGRDSMVLAPWSITQLPLGGRVVLPQALPRAGHRVRPSRNLVLWPYTSWTDGRLAVADGAIEVQATAGPDLKVGCRNDRGWIGYVRATSTIVQRFEPATAGRYPDLECNVETYCGPRYVELEVLGPLSLIEPGAASVLVERWEIRTDIGDTLDPAALCAALARPLSAAADADDADPPAQVA